MKTNTIGFIGGGRITKIFLQALSNKQIKLSSILICDTNPDTLHALKKQFPKIHITDSCELAAKQDIIFIALHPPVIMENLEQIKTSVSEKTQVVSLAPKINIEKIASKLETKNIARTIPNATSYINEGFNPVTFSSEYVVEGKQFFIELLSILGLTFEVEEPKLEAYAIVSAMLPTYFWFQYKEMEKLGVEMGLEQTESRSTVHQTLQAALNLLYKSELTSEEVIDLIPVKPIGENESEIKEILNSKLTGLFNKIKPQQ